MNASRLAELQIQDGCSGGLSKVHRLLFGKDVAFVYCCNEHDLAYEEGGTERDRRLADKRLRRCIADSGRWWRRIVAWVVWFAVRLFGKRHWRYTDAS